MTGSQGARQGAPQVQGTQPEVRIAEAWADFVRVLSVYPETNVRVRAGLDAFQSALEDADRRLDSKSHCDTRAGIPVCFRENVLLCCREDVPFRSGGRLAWLRVRLDSSGLAGVRFHADVAPAALVAFSRQLLANFVQRRTRPSFDTLWPEAYPGLALIDRRFEGEFGGGEGRVAPGTTSDVEPESEPEPAPCDTTAESGSGDTLLDRLLLDSGLRSRLTRLAGGGGDGGARTKALQPDEEFHSARVLLTRIVRNLPAEAFKSLEEVIRSVCSVLDAAEGPAPMGTASIGEGPYDEKSFAILLDRVSRTHFLRRSPGAERLPVACTETEVLALEGDRAREPLIEDDVELLLAEIDQLPKEPTIDFRRGDGESTPEQLAVLLHYVAKLERSDDVQSLRPTVARILADAGEPELEILRRHLEDGASDGEHGAWNARVIDLLGHTDSMHLLFACGVLTADRVVEHFPVHFTTYLQALDLRERSVRNELRDVCRRIGDADLATSVGDLMSELKRLPSTQAHAIAECADRNMLGLVRLLLSSHPTATLGSAARLLRVLDLPEEEIGLLHHINVRHYLTSAYLVALCDQRLGVGSAVYTRAAAAHVLCRHIRATREPDPKAPVRLTSIRALARYRSAEGEELLRELSAGNWLGWGATEPRRVRRLAATVTKEIEEA